MSEPYLSENGRAQLTEEQRREYDEQLPYVGSSLYARRNMLRKILFPTRLHRIRRILRKFFYTNKGTTS